MAINSLLKLVSNTTVVEAGTPQGTVSHALVRSHNLLYTVSRKKGATDFFAVTFTNVDGFS